MKLFLAVPLLLSVALVAGLMSVASAQSDRELSDQEIEYLTQSCTISQGNVQAVQRADLVTRINRVREYQLMLTLMNNFNARAIQNDVDVTDAVLTTASAGEKINKFSADFTLYDTSVREATAINCNEQPFTYFELIEEVRERRGDLQANVAEIDTDLQAFSDSVDVIRDDIGGEDE